MFFSCSIKTNTPPKNIKLRGTLRLIGNEPFTHYAIDEKNGNTTILQTSDEIEEIIRTWQGSEVIVYTHGEINQSMGILVDSVKVVNKKNH